MKEQATIQCPNCGNEINISDILYKQLQQQMEEEFTKKQEEFRAKTTKEFEETINNLSKELNEKSNQVKELNQAKLEIQKLNLEKNELESKIKLEAQQQFNTQLQLEKEKIAKDLQEQNELKFKQKEEQLEGLKKKLEEEQTQQKQQMEEEFTKKQEEFRAKTTKEFEETINNLSKELNEKSNQVKELNQAKLEIQKLNLEKNELESKIKLEAQQQFNTQLQLEKEKIAKDLQEQNELKFKQKEEQLEGLKKKLEEAQRKAELGSQQLQGEVQEQAIEEYLKAQFPFDNILEVKKGVRGGDCVQVVHTREMQNCGKIYYESKRTKEFQRAWIEKFKADMIEKGVDVGVMVSEVLPKELERMGLIDGVYICTFEEFKGLSHILREGIIQMHLVKKSEENKSDKMGLLYHYLTSTEFKMQIESIVEGFSQMQSDLESEKRAMQRIWKQREKQIEKVLENTIAMYGSIKGIAGNSIASVKSLELGAFLDKGQGNLLE
ncbi:hypothetical protein B6S12_00995 [Helicobacter valdiviensis]|uniref:Caldesmon n=1 Tax=Helicobacter valdiviensis TaxID=1458358 RepID=A0A2W6PQA1_9HELI|nr:DUF2130 domain-containing protein [Helicobacter valdiviensis]PZT48903.1 hypothetical protein B6S12_00995 [Helicobacter valdiviensis]